MPSSCILLTEEEKLAMHEKIARYARNVSGTADDLDETLEAAGVEHLNDRAKLTDRIGRLPDDLLAIIEKALLAAVDIRKTG